MNVTARSLGMMIFLLIFTLGLYLFYWLYVTKNEFNRLGAQIPTFFLFFVPIANIYFLYKFAQAFSTYIIKDESRTVMLMYFFLLVLVIPAGAVIYQSHMNERAGEKIN